VCCSSILQSFTLCFLISELRSDLLMPLRVCQVVLAPLWTFLFLDEIPALRTLIGGGVLLVAFVWLTIHPVKAAPPTAEASSTAPMPSALYHVLEPMPSAVHDGLESLELLVVDEKMELVVAVTA
jgi:hypothetical protein